MKPTRTLWIQCLPILACIGSAPLLAAPSSRIQQTVRDWRERQTKYDAAIWAVSGQSMVAKGYMTTFPGIPPDSGEVPPEDRLSEKQVRLVLDLAKNKVRKETRREIFDPSGPKFYPAFDVELYDGQETQLFRPRVENTSSDMHPDKYWTDLEIETEFYQQVFFQYYEYPLLFAHGIFPSREEPLRPARMRRLIDEMLFVEHGVAGPAEAPYLVLRTRPLSDDVDDFYEVWTDPNHQSAVVRWAWIRGGQEQIVIEVQNDSAVPAMPESWTAARYGIDRVVFQWDRLRVDEFTPSPSIDQGVFHIDPTPGMIVRDGTTRRHYRAAQPGQHEISVEQLMAEDMAQPVSTRAWLIVVASVALIVLLCWRLGRTPRRPVGA